MRRPSSHAVPTALGIVLVLVAACSTEGVGGEVDPTLSATPLHTAPSVASSAAQPADGEQISGPADQTDGDDAGPSGTPSTPTAPDPAPPSDADAGPALDGLRLALREVAVLDAPTAMAVRPGDPHLYVAERAGRVRTIAPDGTVSAPLLDISDQTTTGGERGLLGLAWSPAGDRLYLSSSDLGGATRLLALDVVDGVLQEGSRVELLRVPQPASNHNGGNVVIGPDGNLWLGLGDGGGADDQFGQGQRPDTLLATMLRITPDGAGYTVPADNPFVDGGGAPEVWAYGLRNPWRFSFDAATGDLWIADVGQDAVEEINRVGADEAGLNYGWPSFEGDRPFDGRPAEGPVVVPVHTYSHDRGCSITGGYVYRGQAIPALHGAYLYSDFCGGDIWALDVASDGTVRDDVDTGLDVPSPVSFGQGPDGELFVLSINGPVLAIVQE
ncbi:MAG TPA: PQQ-dependent sugar dehydrogenase [Euzebya sp.]|nr:PQQ-dependent sugar dehydrogenase [Euzebya sp.]